MAVGKRSSSVLITILTIGLVGITAIWWCQSTHRKSMAPNIVSFHVINLDRSKDRLLEIQSAAAAAQIPLTRWPAVDGAAIQEEDCVRLGISKSIFRYARDKKQPGIIGCFLSHRGLFEALRDMPVSPDAAHVILEDDATLPVDFWKQWNALPIPADWDIVQLGVTFPNLRQKEGRIHVHLGDRGNVGGFAYVVRHGALPKICSYAAYMYDPMDVMLRNKYKEWKMYIVWPEVCPHNDHGHSIIVSGVGGGA